MRIKTGRYIKEIKKVCTRKTDILIDSMVYLTGDDTEKIEKQLLELGYADLSNYRAILE